MIYGVKCLGNVKVYQQAVLFPIQKIQYIRFDLFIECFTTTFLHTHSWLNWVDADDDEDEVVLKERPEDTRYITKITSK